ncbi:MAG: hypothetical protein LBK54_12910 [Propionibacteriaceae bacterium]|jgi:hypothetical protein|nr:hypothetical protein [Propionibacteriaceae bacterium]
MSLIDRDAVRHSLIDIIADQDPTRLADPAADDTWLDLMATAVVVAEEASQLLNQAVLAARRAELSWARIGDRLGTTRQAAQQRFGRVEPIPWPAYQSQKGRPKRVWRLRPLSFDNELEELERWGRQGWHSVGAGSNFHDVAPSTEIWEHRRLPVTAPESDLGPDWHRIAFVFPYVYYARPTGQPAEPAQPAQPDEPAQSD